MSSTWKRPDLPSKCTFKLTSKISESPHIHVALSERPKICDNVLEAIGNTPMVRLHNIPEKENIKCEIIAKCEYLNPGGSVKDRIAARMILDSEKLNLLKKNDMIIEPTSGNTGIGLALACAIKNYRCTIVLPEKMSQEKISVLKALGAEIIRTRTSANFDDEDSHLRIADNLMKQNERDHHILNQYTNPSNPIAHYDGTAEEIIRDCQDKAPDMVVLTAGTGGTISGIARKMKQKCPNCLIVGVDPRGSMLAKPTELNKKYDGSGVYHVEGIGYDFYPTVLDHEFIDKWYKSDDQNSFTFARRLIREEGFLCGGSSGAAAWGALKAIKDYGFSDDSTKRVVVLLPDSVRNYMTKFLSDDWMISRGFMDFPKSADTLANISLIEMCKSLPEPVCISQDSSITSVLAKLSKESSTGFALVTSNGDCKGDLLGVVDKKLLMRRLMMKIVNKSDSISKAMNKEYLSVKLSENSKATLADAARILMTDPYVVISGFPSGLRILEDEQILLHL